MTSDLKFKHLRKKVRSKRRKVVQYVFPCVWPKPSPPVCIAVGSPARACERIQRVS